MFLVSFLFAVAQASPQAAALFRSGHRRDAVVMMTTELAVRPDDRSLRRSLIECELAVKAYASALEHAGSLRGEFVELRGRALFFLARYEEALADLDEGDPHQVLLVVDALEALGRMSDVDRATRAAASALGPRHPAVQVLLGRSAMRAEEWTEAAEHFAAALASDALAADARFGLGRALIRAGQRERGMEVLAEHRLLLPLLDELEFVRRSLELEPRHAPNHAILGDIERRLGRVEEALSAYRMAAALAEGIEIVPIALRHARLLQEDLGDDEGALAVLAQAGARQRDVRLLVRSGDIARAFGAVVRARQYFEQALELRPSDRTILRRLAALEIGARDGGGD